MIKPYKDIFGQKLYRFDVSIKLDGRRKRIQKKGFSSKETASVAASKAIVTERERYLGIIPQKKKALPTVRDVVLRRIASLKSKKAPRGQQSRKQAIVHLEHFLSMLVDDKPVADLTVAELEMSHFIAYRDERLREVKPTSVFRELTDVCACFNQAYEHFPALKDWRPPRRPKIETPRTKRKVTIAPVHAVRILIDLRRPRETEHDRYGIEPFRAFRARMDAADFFQMVIQSGRRVGEISNRRWDDVLWHLKCLRVDDSKGGGEILVRIPEELLKMLHRRKETSFSRWIFPSDKKRDEPVKRGYTELIRRSAIKLGIPWGYDNPSGIVCHTARHTVATTMLEEGHSVADVQDFMGWSDRTMILNYGHSTPSSLERAVSTLDRFSQVSTLASNIASLPSRMSHKSQSKGSKSRKKSGEKQRKKGKKRETGFEPAIHGLDRKKQSR